MLESSRNHPPPPPRSMEKLSSTEMVPCAKKVGNCCHRDICIQGFLLGPRPLTLIGFSDTGLIQHNITHSS